MVAQCFVVFQIADGPHEDVDAILTKKRLPIARFFSKLMGDFAKGAFIVVQSLKRGNIANGGRFDGPFGFHTGLEVRVTNTLQRGRRVAAGLNSTSNLGAPLHAYWTMVAEIIGKVGNPGIGVSVKGIHIMLVAIEPIQPTANTPVFVSVQRLKDFAEAVFVNEQSVKHLSLFLLAIT